MKAPLLIALGAIALGVVGWLTQGWAGVAMVASTALFLGLLQFHRAMGVLRRAGQAPVGMVPSVVMVHSRLRPGLKLTDLLRLTGSLGRKVGEADAAGPAAGDPDAEALAWRDPGDSEVIVRLRAGKVVDWTLNRP